MKDFIINNNDLVGTLLYNAIVKRAIENICTITIVLYNVQCIVVEKNIDYVVTYNINTIYVNYTIA